MDLVLQNNLIARIKEGNNQAVKELYKLTATYCKGYIIKNNGSEEDAKDFFQKALLIFIEKLRKDKNFTITNNIRTYLIEIIKRQRLNDFKKKSKMRTTSLSDEKENVYSIASESEAEIAKKEEKESQYQKIFDTLKTLSEECQKVINLLYFEQKKDKEIAPLLNYAEGTVRIKRAKCMKKLRMKIGV